MPKKNLYVLNREKKQKINNLKWCLHAATKQSESLTKDLREAYTAITSCIPILEVGSSDYCSHCGDSIYDHASDCIVRTAEDWLKENKE